MSAESKWWLKTVALAFGVAILGIGLPTLFMVLYFQTYPAQP